MSYRMQSMKVGFILGKSQDEAYFLILFSVTGFLHALAQPTDLSGTWALWGVTLCFLPTWPEVKDKDSPP